MQGLKTVFMFSGQGSQYFQMGKALFETNGVFRMHMQRLDDTVRQSTDRSVLASLYAPANRISVPFEQTSLSHPAILMFEYSLAQALMSAGVVPDLVLGASLGSFAAAAVAGALSIDDAMSTVLAHARAMEARCRPGGMIAILADVSLYEQPFLRTNADLAAVNFHSHFIVSAPHETCKDIENELNRRDIVYQRIPVSFAFHSRWVDDAHDTFEALTRHVRTAPARLPIACCDLATTITELRSDHAWAVTRHPIRLPETIAGLEARGIYRYIDVGPSGTLATFLKYLLPGTTRSTAHTLLTPYGKDTTNWERLVPS